MKARPSLLSTRRRRGLRAGLIPQRSGADEHSLSELRPSGKNIIAAYAALWISKSRNKNGSAFALPPPKRAASGSLCVGKLDTFLLSINQHQTKIKRGNDNSVQ